MARLAPTTAVVRRLFALSGNTCAFTGCTTKLIDEDNDFIGQICHIEAAESGGERFNSLMTDEQRRSFENLMLMCYKHHKKTNDVLRYPVSALKSIKEKHEARFKDAEYDLPMEAETKIMREISEKLVEIHADILENKDLSKHTNDMLSEMFSMFKANASALAPSSVTITAAETNIHSIQLSTIKRFRTNYKAVTALEELILLKEKSWDEFNDELRYKVLANIACTLLDLGRSLEAANYLLQLTELKYRTVDSLSYLALGYAIMEDKAKFEEIFRDPILYQSANSNLWTAYIYLFTDVMNVGQIESVIPTTVLKTPEIKYALGEAYVNTGEIEKGLSMLNEVLVSLREEAPKRWLLQGVIASKKLLAITGIEKLVFKSFDSQEKEQIKICINLLTESWDHIQNTELAAASWHLVLNRGVALRALDQLGEAEKDFEKAWQLAHNFTSYKNLLLHYIDTKQHDKAAPLSRILSIDSLPGYNSADFAALTARFAFMTDNPNTAVEILKQKLQTTSGSDRRFILDLIIIGCFDANEIDAALEFIEQLILEFPEDPHGFLAKATYLRRQKKIREAEDSAENAFRLASVGSAPDWIWYPLGEEFYLLRNYDKAIVCYRKMYKSGSNNEITRRLILAYYYHGDYDKAEQLCLVAKLNMSDDPFVNEVLFRIYENSGKNSAAVDIVEQYLMVGSEQTLDHFRLLGVKFYHSKNDLTNLKRLLSEIVDPSSYTMRQQFIIAHMHNVCDNISKGLGVAYEARLRNIESIEAHETYISTMLAGKEEEIAEMYPSAVAHETAVELVDKAGSTSNYFISDDKRLVGPNILRTSDPLATRIIGKGKGECVTMPNSIGTGESLDIKTVMSRNVFAFRESLKLLETKFTGKTKTIFFNGDRFDQFDKYVRDYSIEQNEKREEILRSYNSGAATIGVLATYFGNSVVETWLALTHGSDVGLQCYLRDESYDLVWTVLNKRPIVLEATSLLTIFGLLGRPALLRCVKTKFYIAQATLDEFIAYRHKLDTDRGINSVDNLHDSYYNSFSATSQQKKWLDQIITWCLSNAIQITPKQAITAGENSSDLEQIMGRSAFHSLELARELGATLLSDDAKLKAIAAGQDKTKAFSTYQLTTQNARLNKLSPSNFACLSRDLVRYNHIYIPLTGDDLWILFNESEFQQNPPFTNGVRGLPILNINFAADAISTFAKLLYLNSLPSETIRDTLRYILQTVKRRTDYERLKLTLLQTLNLQFQLLPIQLDDFKQSIMG